MQAALWRPDNWYSRYAKAPLSTSMPMPVKAGVQ